MINEILLSLALAADPQPKESTNISEKLQTEQVQQKEQKQKTDSTQTDSTTTKPTSKTIALIETHFSHDKPWEYRAEVAYLPTGKDGKTKFVVFHQQTGSKEDKEDVSGAYTQARGYYKIKCSFSSLSMIELITGGEDKYSTGISFQPGWLDLFDLRLYVLNTHYNFRADLLASKVIKDAKLFGVKLPDIELRGFASYRDKKGDDPKQGKELYLEARPNFMLSKHLGVGVHATHTNSLRGQQRTVVHGDARYNF